MAHVSQERGIGFIRLLGLAFSDIEVLQGFFMVMNISVRTHVHRHSAFGIFKRDATNEVPPVLPI